MMAGKFTLIGVMMVMLFAANPTQAEICEIVNSSFEDDGPIDDITKQDPNGWTANVPSGQFITKTDASWSTDGNFSLNISSQWFTPFAAGDTAKVSQQVYLADVNEIKFDLKLNTYTGLGWDPNDATAVVMMDDDIVWEPNSVVPDLRGDYLDQSFAVDDKYRDGSLHTLSIRLKINVDTPNGFFEFYRVWWDSIECSFFCNGGGFLAGDFNRDCYIDISDLELVADLWLAELPANDQYNLISDDDTDPNDIVNFFDFSILADNWLLSSYPVEQE